MNDEEKAFLGVVAVVVGLWVGWIAFLIFVIVKILQHFGIL